MANTINGLDAFKKFNTVRTDISANQVGNENNAPLAGKQTSVQAYNYNFRDNSNISSDKAAKKTDFYYVKTSDAKTGGKKLKSKMLPNDPITKFKVEMKKASKLPEYAYRGLKGDPNANFYEFLSLGNIAYFIGGPLLAGVFACGITRNNPQARASAIKRTKQIAVGVGLYYLGAELAKKAIDIPVKIFRGVDLNHPYENVVDCRAVSKTGFSPKKLEYHKVTESVDFTRWDLMYGDETKNNGKAVNEQFDKLAKKFGIDKNVQDSGATLQGSIKKLIVSSTAFKYALTAPFVVLGVALASQEAIGNFGKDFGKNIKNIFKNAADARNIKLGLKVEPRLAGERKTIKAHLTSLKYDFKLKQRAAIVGEIIKGNLITPMKESFKSLWRSNKLGKAVILTAAIAPILANIRILQLTSEKHNKFVDTSEYIPLLNKIKNKKS